MPAVSLALWGALLADDEQRRSRERAWRRDRVLHWLVRDRICDESTADAIWGRALATFHDTWHNQHHTPGVAWCLAEGLAAQGLRPGPHFDGLVAELETRALDDLPAVMPGAREALAALAERWPVALLADVQITPAPVLRECLVALDLSRHLDAAVFSDEVGASKPLLTGFRILGDEVGVVLSDLVHVGPSELRDVAGARAAGARAVRLGAGDTQADAHADDLSTAVERISELLDA